MRTCVGFAASPKGQLHLHLTLSVFPDTPPLLCTLYSSPMHQCFLFRLRTPLNVTLSPRKYLPRPPTNMKYVFVFMKIIM